MTPAVGQSSGKGECHSGNVFEGLYIATQIPRAVEPVVTIGGVHLQRGQAQGYRNVTIRGGYRIPSKTPS